MLTLSKKTRGKKTNIITGKGWLRCLLFVMLAASLGLAGCGSKKAGRDRGMPALVFPENQYESPLDQTELAALHSKGQIDRKLPDSAMPELERQYTHFLRKGRGTMDVFSKRAEKYIGHARSVFRSRGMPDELACLAIVESGYRADARSSVGAAGAWQFMPFTGKKYGLEQDWWVDERLDPYKAVEAAASYLQKLHDDFGDWPTAIAAYNAGEGKMRRALEGTGARDFFGVVERNHKLDEKAQLREETKQYVPRFLAITKIMRNLPQLGFDPIYPEQSANVVRMQARPGTDLRRLSQASGLGWDDFVRHNLHHKRAITASDRMTSVYVPGQNAALAASFLSSRQAGSHAGWRPVTVANSSETLEKISRRSNVSLAELKNANPGIGRIKAGTTVLVPGNAAVSRSLLAADTRRSSEPRAAAARPVASAQAIPAKGGSSGRIGSSNSRRVTYTVQERDSLWGIARRHNVTVEDLKRWNSVDERSLKLGQKLVVELN